MANWTDFLKAPQRPADTRDQTTLRAELERVQAILRFSADAPWAQRKLEEFAACRAQAHEARQRNEELESELARLVETRPADVSAVLVTEAQALRDRIGDLQERLRSAEQARDAERARVELLQIEREDLRAKVAAATPPLVRVRAPEKDDESRCRVTNIEDLCRAEIRRGQDAAKVLAELRVNRILSAGRHLDERVSEPPRRHPRPESFLAPATAKLPKAHRIITREQLNAAAPSLERMREEIVRLAPPGDPRVFEVVALSGSLDERVLLSASRSERLARRWKRLFGRLFGAPLQTLALIDAGGAERGVAAVTSRDGRSIRTDLTRAVLDSRAFFELSDAASEALAVLGNAPWAVATSDSYARVTL